MESLVTIGKKIIPNWLFKIFQSPYHYLLALLGAIRYGFPGRQITIIGITGTKGKTSSAEILNAMLEAGGKKTALAGTLRFKIGDKSRRNMYKMSLPGRFFVQKFLRDAVDAKCDIAVLEITSEAARQYRHKFAGLDGLIFLNISPEHIESHGGFDNYLAAKLSIGKDLEKSKKPNRIIVANSDDKHGQDFLDLDIPTKSSYSLSEATGIELSNNGSRFTFLDQTFNTKLVGRFNISNIIACAHMAQHFRIHSDDIRRGVESIQEIGGRGQRITLPYEHPYRNNQDFTVVVDYAHTPSSLEAIFQAFEHDRKICIIGNTGGGRDKWKRPEMGKIADTYCSHIILSNEDPYDEDPMQILKEMQDGISIAPHEIILDRREAIAKAINMAEKDDVVILTGKGTDPYIMGPNGTKIEWSDADVAQEEIEKRLVAMK